MTKVKKTFLFLCFFPIFYSALSQVPAGYYQSAVGKSGEELRSALFGIIRNHTVVAYDDLWSAYYYTDRMSSGKVWDIYSDVPGGTAAFYFTFGTDKCGNYSSEGDCYNREHTIPKSWFGDATPMLSDLFHLYPTDGYVNNRRGNFAYGEVTNPTYTSSNGSKVGPCAYPQCSGTVFEPIDAYKGDLARTYFYMTVRYMDKNLGQTAESMFDGSSLKTWVQNMLTEWHIEDPVSAKEIDRNNVIYNNFQHNRNPFIDCPELVEYLFGAHEGDPWYPTCVDWDPIAVEEYHLAELQSCHIYPNPVENTCVLTSNYLPIDKVEIFDCAGRQVSRLSAVGTKQTELPTTKLPSGIYFVQVDTRQTVETIKLIVK